MPYSVSVTIIVLVSAIVGYLFGSILTSELVKKIYKVNPREYASHNPGFTNSVRVFGPVGGALVLIGDITKVIIATLIVWGIAHLVLPTETVRITTPWRNTCWVIYLTGFFATVGHIFPIYFKFKGGKGVAAFFGTLVVISPWITLIGMVLFVSLALITKYYSLASLISCLVTALLVFVPWMDYFYLIGGWINHSPNAVWFLNYSDHKVVIIATGTILLLMCTVVGWSHRENIRRIINHTERKFSFHERKS